MNIGWISEDGKSLATMRSRHEKAPRSLCRRPTSHEVAAARASNSCHGPRQDLHLSVPKGRQARLGAPTFCRPATTRTIPSQAKRPAIVYIHGSGYATSVLQQWGSYQELRFVFNNYLSQSRLRVLEMDYRGSTDYGRDWRSGVYLDMGGPDLEDVLGRSRISARSQEHRHGPRRNLGLELWRLYDRCRHVQSPETVFKAGAAFSGVYDWANYNAGYTDERLTTPAENPEAYQRSSPIHFSGRLQNHCLHAARHRR